MCSHVCADKTVRLSSCMAACVYRGNSCEHTVNSIGVIWDIFILLTTSTPACALENPRAVLLLIAGLLCLRAVVSCCCLQDYCVPGLLCPRACYSVSPWCHTSRCQAVGAWPRPGIQPSCQGAGGVPSSSRPHSHLLPQACYCSWGLASQAVGGRAWS